MPKDTTSRQGAPDARPEPEDGRDGIAMRLHRLAESERSARSMGFRHTAAVLARLQARERKAFLSSGVT